MIIYLCVKTHSKTGLKYLCKTKKDPFIYLGSGTDWIPHLKKYGNKHSTEILKECYSKQELNYWGKYYSLLWNVVAAMDDFGNKIWANKIPETGGGGNVVPGKNLNKKYNKDPCYFCNKLFGINGSLLKHEKTCAKNPARMPGFNYGKTREKLSCKYCNKHIDFSQLNNHEKICRTNPKRVNYIQQGKIVPKAKCQHCNRKIGKTVLGKHEKSCLYNPNKSIGKYVRVAPLKICPHCNKSGDGGNMAKNHFDKCKEISKIKK